MKNYIYFLAAFVVFSCSEDGVGPVRKDLSVNNITGKWQLVASSYSIGDAKQHWQTIEDGNIYSFEVDGTFSSDLFEGCDGGNYSIGEATLTLNFLCELENTEFGYIAEILDGQLYLSPKVPTVCIEGCKSKFLKIEE